MFRPRSLQGLSSWPADIRPVTPGRSPSPVQLTNHHDYSGAKRLDVSRYKVLKGHMLFIYHKLASNLGSDGTGQTVLAVALLLVTLGLWLLYAHMAEQVGLDWSGLPCQQCCVALAVGDDACSS